MVKPYKYLNVDELGHYISILLPSYKKLNVLTYLKTT